MWNIYKKELIVDILTQLYPVCITSVVIKTDFRKLKKKKKLPLGVVPLHISHIRFCKD